MLCIEKLKVYDKALTRETDVVYRRIEERFSTRPNLPALEPRPTWN
jgi:hypothetical protein